MTQDEKDKEISAMVQERNKLRGEIACLENKKERIQKGLRALLELNTENRLERIRTAEL